ncbi:MAG TPA: 30S ribosomal protein S16, partial [Mycobacteriales bacterium]|nr:30S ribosomal protein S16 [Mycobacteriales bacterium]
MAVKIKLMRLGKMRAPYYRIVVADARTKREGRVIETIGKYHPKEDPSFIQVDAERASYWLGVGAQPTEPVAAILKVTGDWQKFKGEPAPPPMLVAAPKPDRRAIFEAAARESLDGASKGEATTPRKKAAKAEKPAADKPAEDKATDEKPTEDKPTEAAAEDKATEAAAEDTPTEAATEDQPAEDEK